MGAGAARGAPTSDRSLHLYYSVPVGLHSELSIANSLKSDQRQGFYERHKPITVVMILIVFLLPIVGVFVTGLFGGVLGVIVSVAGYFLTPYAVLKLRDGLF